MFMSIDPNNDSVLAATCNFAAKGNRKKQAGQIPGNGDNDFLPDRLF